MFALTAMRRRMAGCVRAPAVPGHAAGFRTLPEKRRGHGAITAPNGAGPLRRLAPAACVLLSLVGLWPVAAQAQDEGGAVPTVSVAPVSTPVAEGEDAQFTVTRTVVTTGALTVNYRVSETGYMVASGDKGAKTVDFADGESEKTVTVPTEENTYHQSDSTVTLMLTLAADATYELGTDATAKVTVEDDDNANPTGWLAIDDTTPVVGETLTASKRFIADRDGLTGATYAWQWFRVSGGFFETVETEVGTGATYTVVAADVGARLVVELSFTDDDGTEETVQSRRTKTVVTPPPPPPENALVSNTSHAGGSDASEYWRGLAQPFTTGSASGGYDLSSVVLAIELPSSGVRVTIRESRGDGSPGAVRYILINPPSDVGSGLHEYSAPAGATLEAGTVYHVVVGGGAWEAASTAGTTDPGAAPGWSIGTYWYFQPVDDYIIDPEWSPGFNGDSLKIQIRGTEAEAEAEGNTLPTGAPTIDDTTPVVGQTLTADASGIADADGLTNRNFTWQWIRVWDGFEPVESAEVGTGATYTVVAGDLGQRLKVKASFTDDGGTDETVESAETARVERPVVEVGPAAWTVQEGEDGQITVLWTVQEGEDAQFTVLRTVVTTGALTVHYSVSETGDMVASGEEGAKTVAFADGDTEQTVTVPTVDDTGYEADSTVTVTLTADAAYDLGTYDTATVTVEDDDNTDPTGAPTIDDTTPVVGETLTADASGIADADGLTNRNFTWQWLRVRSRYWETPIPGATSATYTVVGADVGWPLKVEASFTDDGGVPEAVRSAETAVVEAAPPPEGVDVLVSNTAGSFRGSAPRGWHAQPFTTGSASGGYDLYSVVLSMNWRDIPTSDTVVTIRESKEDGTPGDIVHTLINLPSHVGGELYEYSAPAGATLEASTVYHVVMEGDDVWWKDGASSTDPGAAPGWEIGTSSWIRQGDTWISYDDVFPRAIQVRGAAKDDGNADPTGAPTIDDTTPRVGETLTADASGIADADGLTSPTFAWQWIRVSGGTQTRISGATAATYTVVATDLGATLKVEASFTDDGGTDETVASAETAAVAAAPPEVTVAPETTPATEGDTITFTLTRTGDPAQTLDVAYEVTASGDFGVTTGAGTATFLANSATVQVSVDTTGDDTHEAHGSVTLTLTADTAADPAYLLGDPSTATAAVEDDDDSPATGTVTVTTATTFTEGETLTADTSGLTDEDGLSNAAYTYQWVRTPAGGGDADISGATGATYVPVFADAGATLKVKVTVTDDEGHEAEFTSTPTSAVAALPRPEVTVTSDGGVAEGSAAVFTLTRTGATAEELAVPYEVAATGDFGVTTGAGSATFLANDSTVQVSLTTTGDDTHEAHGSVTLTLTADTGADPAYLLGDPATATATVEDDDDSPTTGSVTVTGTATEGETLTADTSGVTDADGLADAAYAYQWVRTPAGGSDEDISGATSQTYVPVFADAGATLKVKVTVIDDDGHEASFTSTPTSAVAAAARPEVTVASDGDVTEGSPAEFTLTRTGDLAQTLDVAYAVTATGDFGVTPSTDTATFLANSATVQVSVDTTGDSTHEAHGSVTVTLTADTGADPAYLLGDPSAATAAVEDDDDSPATGSVTVTGTATEGETLTANTSGLTDADGLADAAYAYQWVRTPSGGSDADISGATSQTYVPVFADAGATLKVRVTVTDDEGHEATFESAATATVEATARPSVTVVSDGDVTEGGTVTFTLTRTGDTAEELDVAYEVAATGDFGVTPGAGTATFLADSATVQVSVATTGDGVHEAHGSVTLTLTADTSANPAYQLGAPSTATAEVRDDDNAEPTGAPTIDDTTPEVGQTLTVNTSGIDDPDGLATPGFTWQWIRVPSGGTATRISGATAASYTVVAADEGATLKVEASFTDDDGTTETLTSTETAAVEAAAPTVPEISIVPGVGGSLITEGGNVTFTLTISEPPAALLLVNLRVTETGDMMMAHNLQFPIVAVFPPGKETATLSYETVLDDTDEPNSTVTAEIVEREGSNYVPGTPSMASVEVRDDDRPDGNAAPTGAPTIDDTTPVVGETLTADPSGIDDPDGLTGATFTWRWIRVASGGAETVVGTGTTYVVVAEDVDATLKVEASFTDDAGIEETVESAVTSAVEAVLLPAVSVARVSTPVEEGEDAQFRVTRRGVTTGALTVNYGVSETGDMVASGEEGAKTVAFGDGETRQTVTVPTAEDAVHEADSTVTLTLTADASYVLGTDATAEVMVEDDDNAAPTGAPTIDDTTPVVGQTLTADPSGIGDADGLTNPITLQWIRVASGGGETEVGTGVSYTVVDADRGSTLKVKASFRDDDGTEETIESEETAAAERPSAITPSSDGDVTEGDPAVWTLTRTGSTAGMLRVKFDIEPSGGDFGLTLTADGTTTTFPVGSRTEVEATFPVGSSTMKVSLSTVDDNTHEADGTVFLTVLLSEDEVYALGDTDFATLKIRDNDNAAPTGAPTIDDTTPVVGETLTADASGIDDPDGLTDEIDLQWIRVSGSTETRISGATAATYTVVAADVGATLKVEASFTDDDGTDEAVESAETATVEAAPVLPALSIGDASVDEGDSGSTTLDFTVTLDSAATATVTVEWATSDGTATAGTDYTAGNGTLTFNAGDSSKTVSVTVAGDNVDEPDETFEVTLTNPSGATLGDDTATGTITNDDDPPTVTLVLTPDTITEASGVSTVTATLDHPSSEETTVTVTATPESPAVAGDYTLSGSELTIAAGATTSTGTVTITAVDNAVDAPHKRVTVSATATNAQGITAPQDVTLTVTDDENVAATGRPTIDDKTPVVGETLTVDTSGIGDSDGLAGVAYAYRWLRVASGGAVTEVGTGQSYTVVAEDVGSTLKVEVTFTDEGGAEERVESVVTVAAEALPEVTVASDGDVTEGSPAVFTLTRTGSTAETLDVDYEVTATGDFGVTPFSGTATFLADSSTVQVTVATTGDDTHEAHGSVTLTLTADTSADPAYLLGDPADATAAVEDDDDSPASGAVTVTGTATEGETLTTDTSGVTDADGLGNAAEVYVYQWVRTPAGGSDEDISGATSQTYVPVFADAGATLKVKVTVTDDEGHEATFTSAPTSAVAALPRPSVTVVSDGDVTEGSPAVFTLTRTGDLAQTLDVAYAVTATGDFGAATGAGTATFLANNATVQVSVATTGDSAHEAHGTVTVTLTADTGADPAYLLGDPSTATAAVEDDDDSPASGVVTVTTATTFTEGETLSADTLGLTDGDGLADAGYAYQWVRTPSGGSDADISGANGATYVPVFADVGATLKVKVTVTDDEGHQAEFTSAPTSAIAALPRPSVTVASDGDVTEGRAAVFTLTRTGDLAGTLDVAYEVTATGEFGVTTGASTATFLANSLTVQVSVDTTGDSAHEAHGSVTVTLMEDTGADPAYLLGDPSTATAAVRDDDDSPATGSVTVTTATTFTEGETLTADTSGLTDGDGLANAAWAYQWVRTPSGGSDADISGATDATYVPVFADMGATLKVRVTVTDDEGHEATFTSAATSAVAAAPRPSVTVASDGDVTEGSAAVFTLTRTGDPAQPLDVAYAVTATGDFGAATGAGTATFLANDATVQVSVATTGDATHEAHGAVTLTVLPGNGYRVGTPSAATAKIFDATNVAPTGAPTIDDTSPVVGEMLTADPSGIADADGLTSRSFTWQWVRVSGGTETPIDGATAVTYTVVAADVGATLKVKASFTDDGGIEETVESAQTSAAKPPSPVLTVAAGTSRVTEGTAATFTVTRTVITAGALTAHYQVSETGDAVAASDEGAKSVDFADGETGKTVTVPTAGDGGHEADSVVTVTLTADAAYELGAQRSAEVTVEDDDNAAPTGAVTIDDPTPVVGQTLTADTSNLDDPDGLTSRSFTWQWLRVSGGTETVIAGASTASYPVAAADIGAMLKVRVGFTDDDGAAETVESAPTGAVAEYTITAVSPRVTEGDDGSALLDFALTRSETGQRLELGWRVTTEGTARPVRPIIDFAGPMEGTLVFSPNTRSRSVYLQVVPDIVDELDETVVLEFFSVAGTPEGVTFPATVTGTIVDDDTATLSIAPSSVDEGDSGTRELVFTVSLDLESDREVTVEYDVGGTAESGADYAAPTPARVTFPALSWEPQRIVFRVLGDTDAERHETVEVELRDPTGGAALGTSRAEGTIRNDDGLVVSVDPPEVAEGDSRADGARLTFRLELSGQADTDVTVDYRVDAGAGTATPGADFKDKSGTVRIRSGRTFAVVKLGILEDTAIEPDETVVMVFENPRGAVLHPDSARVTGTILDDDLSQVNGDLSQVTVAAEAGPVTEGEDAVFVLTRTGDTSAPLTVTVDVSEAGSVLAGPAPTEVTFGADEAQTRLRVATEDDATAEADGRVTATVIAGTGYTVAAGAGSAGVDVFDDDAPAAPEETVTLWSTTMTVADLGGWVGASGPDLADPDWSEDGVEYAMNRLRWLGSPKDRVVVRFSRRPPLAEELTLHAGELTLALAEGGSGRVLRWPVEGEPWSVGEEVALRLTRTVAGEDQDGAAGAGISVADARVNESAGAPLAFRVTLDEARTSVVSVRYATSDGSATAGADYVAASGVVRFEAGETEKTVHVAVLEDAHDEGKETMTLTLSHPFGAEVSDGVATGTIVNTDAMPRAWLGRFGRTVAGQVVDAVEARMTAARQAGVEVSIAGRRVGAAGAFDEAAFRDGGAAGGRPAGWHAGESGSEGLDEAGGRLAEWLGGGVDSEERTVRGRELLTGTSFARTEGTAESGFVSLWGRGVVTDFDGRDGALSVDGEVATGLLGADWARADWAAGLMVGHSRGKGSYSGGQGAGTVSSSLTGLYPWGRRTLSDRMMVWGVVGYGEGTLTLEPEGEARIETDMDLAMAAAGLRGVLVEAPEEGGFELAAKTDGLIVRSASDRAEGSDGGMLEAASAKVTRLRLGLEGTRVFRSEGGGTVTPSFGLGVRHDGGDAETGFGVDLGVGLAYADPSSGVTADLRGRGLLGHEASGFREFGFSGSLAFDPTPSSDRGLSLSLRQTVGASATGGVEALYGRDTMAGLGGADAGAGSVDSAGRRRLEARVGYGVSAFGGRFTGTPELGFGLSESGRDYRLGWRLTQAGGSAGAFELSVEATRREAAHGDGSEHGVGVRATILGWRLTQAGGSAGAFELSVEATRREAANGDGSEHGVGVRATIRW